MYRTQVPTSVGKWMKWRQSRTIRRIRRISLRQRRQNHRSIVGEVFDFIPNKITNENDTLTERETTVGVGNSITWSANALDTQRKDQSTSQDQDRQGKEERETQEREGQSRGTPCRGLFLVGPGLNPKENPSVFVRWVTQWWKHAAREQHHGRTQHGGQKLHQCYHALITNKNIM